VVRHAQHLFLAEGFSLVFTDAYVENAYIENAYIDATYVNNAYVDCIFVLNLGGVVRTRLQPGPNGWWAYPLPSGGRSLFH